MITDAVINWFFGVVLWVVGLFPVVDIPAFDANGNNIYTAISTANFFLPVNDAVASIGVILAVLAAKGVIRLVGLFFGNIS